MGSRGRRGGLLASRQSRWQWQPRSHLGLLTVGRGGPSSRVHTALTLICSPAMPSSGGTEARTAALGLNRPRPCPPSQGCTGLSRGLLAPPCCGCGLSFAFFLAGRNPTGNPLSCPRTRVSHPFPACQVGGVTPSELAGEGGAALPGQGPATHAPSPSVLNSAHLAGLSSESN